MVRTKPLSINLYKTQHKSNKLSNSGSRKYEMNRMSNLRRKYLKTIASLQITITILNYQKLVHRDLSQSGQSLKHLRN